MRALPKIRAGGQQEEFHADVASEGLQQIHLNRRQIADAEKTQAGRQRLSRLLAIAQFQNRLLHLEAKRLAGQLLGDGPGQNGLPLQSIRQRCAALASQPFGKFLRPVERIVVHRIGEAARQLPLVFVELSRRALMALPPLTQAGGAVVVQKVWQHFQHGPHQAFRAPWIVAGFVGTEHGVHQLPQPAAWEREAHQGADAIDGGELLPQPAAGGPGVHHHLELFKGPRGVKPQLMGQQLGQQLCPIAAVNLQQGTPVVRGRCGRWTAWSAGCPITCTTAWVSGQNAVSKPP